MPSLTELLFALGLGPWVVARTGYCIAPGRGVAAVPKVGGTKDVNLAKLRRLAPTHAIVNVDENRIETAEALRAFVPQVIVTHPCGPRGRGGADRADRRAPSRRARRGRARGGLARRAARRTRRHDGAAGRARALPDLARAVDDRRPRHLHLAPAGPRRLADAAGAARRRARRGALPALHGDEPWLADVREVLLSSEPYAFTAEHVAQAQALCPQARVRLVDGELLSWYGPRTAAGLRYLRELGRRLSIARWICSSR